VEKKIVSKKPENEPTEADTACNNNEDIMLNLSNFKIFQIYTIFFFLNSWVKCTTRKEKTDSANDQNPCSSKMRPLMFILFKYNLILKTINFSIKLRSNEIDKIQQKGFNSLIIDQQPLSCASNAYRFVYFF
jgi:hypothetical protein